MGQADQSEVVRLGSHSDSVLAIVWLDDGTLETGTRDGKIYLWGVYVYMDQVDRIGSDRIGSDRIEWIGGSVDRWIGGSIRLDTYI